ncbi:MAG: lytic murein transglycosylase, partial [Solirubrobacteraceae bacterium]
RSHSVAIAYAAGSPVAHRHCAAPAGNQPAASPAGSGQHAPLGATLRMSPAGTPAPSIAPTGTGTSTARRHRRPTIDRSGGAALTRPAPRPVVQPAPVATPVTTLSTWAPGFLGPKAWTGTVTANPALTGAVDNLSGLLSDGNRPPSFLIPIYMEAGLRYNVPWEVLAAINAIESDYGRNLNTSSAGALGWMQFEPSTWQRYGVAVDGHSVANPYDPRDAIFSAARYLAAAGAAQDISRAVYAYNHATWYVNEVLSRAQAIAGHVQYERAAVRRGTFSVDFATGLRRRPIVSYRSGVLTHYDRLIAAANMVSAADFPYVWGGGHEQPARFGPFDCSGSVSYVIQQAGYKVPTTVSGNIALWKFPTGPGQVTIFYNPTHTFMRIGNRFFGTSGFARPGGGAGWFSVDKLPADYLAGFREVHVPKLGINSFAPGSLPPAPVHRILHRSGSSPRPMSQTLPLSSLGSFPRS